MARNVKKRNWAMVLYPESAPTDWRQKLAETGLQCAISPLHDKDINPDGEPKKAHYHVIMCYSGPTSFNVVKGLTDSLSQPIPQPLEQIRGYYRYLTHKDNPEKYQYEETDIATINGFDIAEFVELTRTEIEKIKKEIIDLIHEHDIYEYADLIDLLAYTEGEVAATQFNVASNHTLFFNSYLKSRHFKKVPKDYSQGASEVGLSDPRSDTP